MGYHRGYSPTPETRAKMRAAAIGRKLLPETIEKIRQAALGRKASPETCAKLSAAMLKCWSKGNHGSRVKSPVPGHLKSYASKLRGIGIKGQQFRQAIEAAQ